MAEAVRVIVRCRPFNNREKGLNSKKIVRIHKDIKQVQLVNPEAPDEEPKTFVFDAVFDDDCTQREVYQAAAEPLVRDVIEGFNGTIFAYGQTGAGKSWSMEGARSGPEDLKGIIPKSFIQVFAEISANTNPSKQFLVQASYIEIYNENVRDLLCLDPKDLDTPLDLKEDPDKGVYIKGLSMHVVKDADEIQTHMTRGNDRRQVGATLMNATSSRSHSIFTIRMETSEPDPIKSAQTLQQEFKIKAGKLNLVDLAGSERQGKTGATGDRLKEATKINLSLSALGNVISALVAGKGKHIPYRDSKLTRLLQDSLGGNTKTTMCAAISPADDNYDETLSTLRYANRAKNIQNKPKVNEDPKDALLKEYQSEIARLKAMLRAQGIELPDDIGGEPAGGEPASKPAASSGGAPAPARAAARNNNDNDNDDGGNADDPAPAPVRRAQAAPRAPSGDNEDGYSQPSQNQGAKDGPASPRDLADNVVYRDGPAREVQVAVLPDMSEFVGPGGDDRWSKFKADWAAQQKVLEEERSRHDKKVEELALQLQMEVDKMETELEAIQDPVTRKQREEAALELQTRIREEKDRHEQLANDVEDKLRFIGGRRNIMEEQMARLKDDSAATQQQMKKRLEKMQKKLIRGHGEAQSQAKMLADQLAREQAEKEALAARQAELDEQKLLIEETYQSAMDELQGKTRKLKKLQHKYKASLEEIKDLTSEFELEKEGYLNNIRDVMRELRLYKAICGEVLTASDLDKIVKRASWSDAKDMWILPPIDMPVVFPRVGMAPEPPSGARAQTAYGARKPMGESSRYLTQETNNNSNNNTYTKASAAADPAGWRKSILANDERKEGFKKTAAQQQAPKAVPSRLSNMGDTQPSVRFAPGPSLRRALGEEEGKVSIPNNSSAPKRDISDTPAISRAAFDPSTDKTLFSVSRQDPLEKFKQLPDSMNMTRKNFDTDATPFKRAAEDNTPPANLPLPASMQNARARPSFDVAGIPGPKQSNELSDSMGRKVRSDSVGSTNMGEQADAALRFDSNRKSFAAPPQFASGHADMQNQASAALNVDITRKSFAKPTSPVFGSSNPSGSMDGALFRQLAAKPTFSPSLGPGMGPPIEDNGVDAALGRQVGRKNFSVDGSFKPAQQNPADYFGAADAALNARPRGNFAPGGGFGSPAQSSVFGSPGVRQSYQMPKTLLD